MEPAAQIRSFADKHLTPYTIRADELIPELCPFCRGGDRVDRRTFAINLREGVYVCKRGSCGARGRFEDLARHFGERAEFLRSAAGLRKQFVLPKMQILPPTPGILSYFENRKISAETLRAFGIGADDRGNIVFPFYRDDALVYLKFRPPHKPQDNERKEWQMPGAKPILFGMDLCSFAQPQIITEGQIDALSLYEAGVRNVVSVPCGCSNLNWLDHCWEWLEKFQSIILFGDNDEPGRKMIRDVVRRLDEARCLIVEDYPECPDGSACKDANDILMFCGTDT